MKKRTIELETLQKFETHLKNEEKSEATVKKYMHDVGCFASFIDRVEVCKQNVMDYKNKLKDSYAVSSANSMIAALNSFFKFCGWQDLCVKQFRAQRQAYCSEERELNHAEYYRLLDAANERHNERLNLIIQTICGTGIRVSELQYITVEALKHGEAIVNCKGKNRRIFIVSALKKKLISYAKKRKITSGMIFITRSGRPVSRNNIWKEMKGLCKQAHVAASKVFPHNLRHLFARAFYKIDKDIAKLADILGHSSIETTRIYIITTGEEHRRRMENLRLII